jgi:general secretion pathway protein H
MPISDRGLCSSRRRAATARAGFTLVEILVVIVVVAVASAATLTYLRPAAPDPAREGLRLATLLERLGLEARLSGQRMAWRCDGTGLAFEVWRSEGLSAAGSWQAWSALPRTELAEGLRFGSLTLNGRPAECVQRIVAPVFGNASAFSLEIVGGEADSGRRISGDIAGHVSVERPQN